MAKSLPSKSPTTRSAKKPPAIPVIKHDLLLGPTLARRKRRAKENHALVRRANRMARVRTMRHSYIAKANSSEADRHNAQEEDAGALDMREEIERENGGQHMLLSLKQGKSGPEVPIDEKTESRVATRARSTRQSDRQEVQANAGLQTRSSDDRAEGNKSPGQPAKKRTTGSPPRKSSHKKAASSLAKIVTPDAVKTRRRFQDGDAKREPSEKKSAKLANDPHPHGGSTQKAPAEEDYRIFLKQQRALSALMASTELISIRASLGLVKELFEGYDEVPPEVFQLANDAEVTSRYLMFQSLSDILTSPKSFGGLAISDIKATSLINQLFEAMGHNLYIEVVSIEKMQLVGASIVDSRKLLPLVKTIGEEVRKKEMALKKEINDSVLEMTCSNPLPYVVMSGSTYQRNMH
jgi:hypothetical protein